MFLSNLIIWVKISNWSSFSLWYLWQGSSLIDCNEETELSWEIKLSPNPVLEVWYNFVIAIRSSLTSNWTFWSKDLLDACLHKLMFSFVSLKRTKTCLTVAPDFESSFDDLYLKDDWLSSNVKFSDYVWRSLRMEFLLSQNLSNWPQI